VSEQRGVLGPEQIRESISLDALGNVTGHLTQPSGSLNLYRQEDGTYALLPRIAGGAPTKRPSVSNPAELLSWVQDGLTSNQPTILGIEGRLGDVNRAGTDLNGLSTADVPAFVSKVSGLQGRVRLFTRDLATADSALTAAESPLIDPHTGLPFVKTTLTGIERNQPRNLKTPAQLTANLAGLEVDVAALEGDVQPQLTDLNQKVTDATNAGTAPAASSLWVAVRSKIAELTPILIGFKRRLQGLQSRLSGLKLTSLDSTVQPLDSQRPLLTSQLATLKGEIGTVDLTALKNAALPLLTEIGGLKGDGQALAVPLDLINGQLQGFQPGAIRRQLQSIDGQIVELRTALTDLEASLGASPDPLLTSQIGDQKIKVGQAAADVAGLLNNLSILEGQLPGMKTSAAGLGRTLNDQPGILDQQVQFLDLKPITARLNELNTFVTDSAVPLTTAENWRTALGKGTNVETKLTSTGTLLTSFDAAAAGASQQLLEPLRFGEAYPIRLWPNAVASIFDGHFQRGGDVHLYAVAMGQGTAGKPQSFAASDIAAYGSVTPDQWEVSWKDVM
jgi:hypothetical protein